MKSLSFNQKRLACGILTVLTVLAWANFYFELGLLGPYARQWAVAGFVLLYLFLVFVGPTIQEIEDYREARGLGRNSAGYLKAQGLINSLSETLRKTIVTTSLLVAILVSINHLFEFGFFGQYSMHAMVGSIVLCILCFQFVRPSSDAEPNKSTLQRDDENDDKAEPLP